MNSFLRRMFCENDAAFHAGVAVAMCIIYMAGAGVPIIVDPQLKNHIIYGARHYPGHVYWQVPFLGLAVLVATHFLLRLARPSFFVWVASAPLLVVGVYTFWLLRPEVPHSYLAVHMTFGCILTTMAIWIRGCSVEKRYIVAADVLPQAKIERAREEVSFWKTVLLSCVAGSATIIFGWIKLGREINSSITPNQAEQIILSKTASICVGVHGCWFFAGVLAQLFRKYREALGLLEGIPSDFKSAERMSFSKAKDASGHSGEGSVTVAKGKER